MFPFVIPALWKKGAASGLLSFLRSATPYTIRTRTFIAHSCTSFLHKGEHM